ncbi:Mitochondrial import inner membrane translocase subunit Tim10 B [Holothuria leucospilota]|uniref:Mitochondrial import inner membrane translocase subunit n=1 Tax=Holothuria leucospilota TaxID=206669 RepID=A0A9Q1GYK2_HOLLE|nr:Mitochondrial import inner membrane translocase subunit Tim10 B [Holothuria leucospilota]
MMDANQTEVARRNMKDFLTMYNTFTESCFNSCVKNFNYRYLTEEEKKCSENCTSKLVNINHRLISVYMDINPMNRQLAANQAQPANLTAEMQSPGNPAQATPSKIEHQVSPGNLADQVQQVFGEGTEIKADQNAQNG